MGSGRTNAWTSYYAREKKAKETNPELYAMYHETISTLSNHEWVAQNILHTAQYDEFDKYKKEVINPLKEKLNEIYDQLYPKQIKGEKK